MAFISQGFLRRKNISQLKKLVPTKAKRFLSMGVPRHHAICSQTHEFLFKGHLEGGHIFGLSRPRNNTSAD
jgi:hypothetical protein